MKTVFIGVGSNSGNRKANLDLARFLLARRDGIRIVRASPLYETPAVVRPGVLPEEMPDFLNGVLRIETDLEPEELLSLLEDVERLVGRHRKGDWSPRPLDLDILFYGDMIMATERLTIPHPELEHRWFVLKPFLDLDPDFVHPVLGKTIKEVFDAALH